jgi:hypothetical protein
MKRRYIVVILLGTFVTYCASYAYLRHSRWFIHRAGEYGDPPGNHYIEVGRLDDGPSIFAAALLASQEDSKTNEKKLNQFLQETGQKIEKEKEFRNRVFLFFLPLAFSESFCWKLVQPHPLEKT